ncbi:terminase large subunit domain-containing protein [Pseudoalteromonas ruthenica]|uniref:terminase large subunit domain-containing protein n=1 Tax=Pseudoalteromonas ruthenica TaxID=151081 RepID=UPI00110AE9FD|nr:terminase family protein [Pseudoalteromonas ruthenica]TMO97556.1 terminase [Pseudoalteromonas ruthenica]
MKLRYGPEIRKTARLEYVIGGLTFDEIAEKDGMPSARQLRRWAIEENWHEQSPALSAELKFSRRLCLLADKEDKTEKDYKEIDFLTGQICKLNASKNAPSTKKQRDDESQESQSNERKKKKKRIKNDVSSITKEKLDELKNELLYPHQLHWFDNQDHRMRFILKPRQIGATFYFAFEAFYDAVVNGRNKVFISASRDQAEIFKSNIIALCREHFDIELTGSPMTLFVDGKSITLYFKSTNSRTAQSSSGDLYIDEVFWIPKYKELKGLAQAMATHKKYRITYFSTPSVTSHEAYDHWNGKWYQKTMACNDPEFKVDVSHKNLKTGKLCEDGIWRQLLTVVDVVNSGFDRIDVEQLKSEYSKDEFNNLFMGKFIDDAHSAFNIKELMACMVDSKEHWPDVDFDFERPYAMKPVVIGFDPARTIDKATVVVLTLPGPGEKFRLLETLDLTGNRYQEMADEIELLTQRYNVQHIGVDTTGIGSGVFEMIQEFFPMAMPLHYNPALKTRLVIKAQQVIGSKRFEFDKKAVPVTSSFMNVRKKVVGDNVTYASNRSATTGHADLAWAIMHALIYEPLTGNTNNRQTTVGIAA